MESPIVNVKQGKLRGHTVKNVLGGFYISFKGIPFAAPPVGELRFEDPVPPIPWIGVRDASNYIGGIAPQLNLLISDEVVGDEDCLYLSVHTTALDKVKPVIVWIHGGGFYQGSERFAQPDYLVAKDVVVVTINYRIGVLGFLNLDHEIAAGNQGMKDQVAALQWVKENIINFGGDPNNITVYGASAGAASAHLLALSPMSQGLFHKAILQSGTANCCWTFEGGRSEYSFRLARNLGYNSENPVEVFKFLKTIPAKDLVNAQSTILTTDEKRLMHIPFTPRTDAAAKNPFFPRPVHEFQRNADHKPMIVGYTSHEFIMFIKDTSEKRIQEIGDSFDDLIHKALPLMDPRKIQELSRELRNWYFNGKIIKVDQIPGLVQFLSDIHITNPAKQVANARRNDRCAPTYLYRFSYVGNEMTMTKQLLKELPMAGASHVDDSAYIWYQGLYKVDNPDPPAIGTKDRNTLERLTSMWSNFAKTGNPTSNLSEYVKVPWNAIQKHDFSYFDIGDELQNISLEKDVWHVYNKYEEHDEQRMSI